MVDRTRTTEIYNEILTSILQVTLKKVLKAWIKVVQPRKQSNNPYNGGKNKLIAIDQYGKNRAGELTRPDWWPENINHRGPDHLPKHG